MRFHRRHVLAGLMAGPSALLGAHRALASAPARSLSLLNLHTGESLKADYWENGAYVADALAAFDKVLRDHRTGEIHPIAPGVLDLAVAVSNRLGVQETVQIISGYRSPATNARLHEASSGVAVHSLHMDGKALDIRLAGVDLARLRDAAWSLQGGGVGFYPESNFVHIDVGRIRRW